MGFPDLGKAKMAIQRVIPLVDRKSTIDSSATDGFQGAEMKGEIELRYGSGASQRAFGRQLAVSVTGTGTAKLHRGRRGQG